MTLNLIGAQLMTQSDGTSASYYYIVDGAPTESFPVETVGHDPIDADGNIISTSYVREDGTVHDEPTATFHLRDTYVTVELNSDYRMIVTDISEA